jgi:hypothetical protein
MNSVIDIAPLLQAAATYLGTVVIGIAAWWLNGHVSNENTRKAILDAAENAMAHAVQRVDAATKDGVQVKDVPALISFAYPYMQNAVGDALKKQSMSPRKVIDLLVAKAPQIDGSITDTQLNQIAAVASGTAPPPNADLNALSAELAPLVKQWVKDGIAAHYTDSAAPFTGKPTAKENPSVAAAPQ